MSSKEGAFPVVYLTGDSADAWGAFLTASSAKVVCAGSACHCRFPNFSIPAHLRNRAYRRAVGSKGSNPPGVKASGAQSLGKVGESLG
jgi:hypothetical protein